MTAATLSRVTGGGVAHRVAPGAASLHRHALDARRLSLGLRVPAFAALTTGATVGGHVAAHGTTPSLLVTLGLFGGALSGRAVLGTRRRSFLPIAGLMTLGQMVGHTVLAVAETTGSVMSEAAALEHMAGHHHGLPAVDAAAAHQMVSPMMVLAHGCVAVVLAWWLARGEALSDALGRRLIDRLVIPTLPHLDIAPVWAPGGGGVPRVGPGRFVLAPAPGRAPPRRR